jgi:hypothetical protein
MTILEIRPHPWGWKVFEVLGVEPVFPEGSGGRGDDARVNARVGPFQRRRYAVLGPVPIRLRIPALVKLFNALRVVVTFIFSCFAHSPDVI